LDRAASDRHGIDEPSAHRPTGTGTPDNESAIGSAEPGDRKPGEGSASASGMPSGLGWPGGLGSPAGLDLPALDAPTISLPAVGRPTSEPTGGPAFPGGRNGGGLGGAEAGNGSSLGSNGAGTDSLGPDGAGSGGLGSNGAGSGLGPNGAGSGGSVGSAGSGWGNGGGAGSAAGPEAAGEQGPSTDDGLPRRVRQANLAPQLRHRPPTALPDEATVPLRPPEQIRAIMSALQQGTQRGRRDAAQIGAQPPADPTSREAGSTPESSDLEITGNEAPPEGASFADAATVSFPAIVNLAAAADDATDGTGGDAAVGDRGAGSEQTDVTRPEKDA
jgi:hypothetical protein